MPHNPTSITSWSTAQEFNSGEAATSTQYNQIVNNLSLMYARPYIMVVNSTNQSLSNGAAIFTSGAPNTITNSPASLAGSITFSGNTITIPAGIGSGLFRVTMFVSCALNATSSVYAMSATFAGGSAANNHVVYTSRVTTSSTAPTWSTGSFIIPMQGGGGTYPNSVSFNLLTSATQTVNGNSLPLSSTTTFAQLEYLGASTGSI